VSRELKPLHEVLQRAVAAARLHVRTVEQALGLPVGGWDQLLSGDRVLRVRHLLALARLLRVPPADFLEIGLPEASRAAELRLSHWLEPAKPRSRSAQPTPTKDDWQARIEEAVRRELQAAAERQPLRVPE
jgi:transcriptional regulator with XRE-family HTH domain